MKEKKFDKYKYDTAYKKEHLIRIYIKFRNEEDEDIIEKLETVPNKAQYIKQLIRDDLSKK